MRAHHFVIKRLHFPPEARRCFEHATDLHDLPAGIAMNFLGCQLVAGFQGEVVSDLPSFACRRVGGARIKHRVK